MEGRFSGEKIDHTVSKEYKEEKSLEEQNTRNKRDSVFGSLEIKVFDLMGIGGSEKGESEMFDSMMKTLRRKFSTLFDRDDFNLSIFLKIVLRNEQVISGFEDFFAKVDFSFTQGNKPEELNKLLQEDPDFLKVLPDTLLEKIIRAYVEFCGVWQKNFEKNVLPELLSKVDNRFRDAIQKGLLPIDLDRWESIRDNTAIVPADPIFNLREEAGSYGSSSGISIAPFLSAVETERTLIHEFLHALAGKTVSEISADGHHYFDEQRSGLGFNSDGDVGRVERFRWLDEAVTEDTAIAVAGGPADHDGYVYPREILNLICENLGPNSKGLFIDTYFENYDPESPSEKRLENYRKMMRVVAEKFGSGFLVNLDKFICGQRNGSGQKIDWLVGVKKVAETMKELGNDFPLFLGNWVHNNDAKFRIIGRDMVKRFKEEKAKIFDRLTADDIYNDFDKLWNKYFLKIIPSSTSPSDIFVIKEVVEVFLLRERS